MEYLNKNLNNIKKNTMKTKEDVLKSLENVMHPAINFSLVKLGIVKDIIIENDNAKVIFALPFANIPIINDLMFLISQPIRRKSKIYAIRS